MAKKLPKIITPEEYEKLFKEAQKSKLKRKKQYLVAMELSAKAGLRISEVLGFKRKDGTIIPPLTKDKIDLQAHTIRIDGAKGKKDRIVPCPKTINERAIKHLPLEMKERRNLQRFIEQIGYKALDKRISFHTLRHYFGTQCAEKMPLHQVQMLMGHSRLDTTGIYLHANPKQAIENAREVF